ncbi:MAG: hypothetical protein H6Q89_44 [Myxococcaceae bacterium]|nr:hypothetical protein [Myxococcaceae bacterium]
MNRILIGSIFAVFAFGCSANLPPGTTVDNPIVPGQQDFISLERDYSNDRNAGYDTAGGAPGASSETGGQAGPPSNAKAPSGREGTVEEADIYRVDANRLFYLNTYRGFIIYDLNDPKNPKQVSRLPVHGYPIEMFVTPTTVYALLRDALYVTQDIQGLSFKRHNVSQLVAIDIQDIKNPKILQTIDIVGELKEGVSRKIDDTVYLVSHLPQSYYWAGYPYAGERTEQAWVYSFNVADPKHVVQMQKLKVFEGGGSQTNTNGSSTSRYFSGVTISATSNTLHVVENWHTYGWVSGSNYNCGSYRSMQEAVVSIIDISDPTGKIRLHSRFSTYGSLNDQFKQTYVHDPVSGKGYYLGIFQRQEWSSINCSGTSFTQNNLESWDITDGEHPVRVSSLSFGKPNETVRGSTFDTKRSVAFAITARQIDPLYAISFADPTKLAILSQIDGLSGDMNVFRLVGDGKFLLGIGRDNDATCSGYGTAATGWSANVAVSVIDVQNLSAIRLVQRKCVTVNNASWVWSDLNWNLDQAHKMLGMHSDARASVISVPVSYYAKSGTGDWWWWYRPESAVGLMSFDLAAYDPAKDHLNQQVLNNHGTVVHTAGHVVRSIVFTHKVGTVERRMMVNLSQTHVSVTDIENLNLPAPQSVIEVAPYHQRLHRFGDFVVDEVRQGSEYSYQPGASEFRIKRAGKGLDEGEVVASFTVPRVQQVMQFKNLLVLFRQANDTATPYYQRKTQAVIYDLTVPTAPVKLSEADLPTQVMPYVWYGCGGWGYYPSYYGGTWAASDLGLGLLNWTYANNSSTQQLIFLDLSAPATPKVVTRTLATQTYDSRWGYTNAGRQYVNLIGDGTRLIANYKEKVGTFDMGDGTRFAQMRYYAEVFPTADLVPQVAINVPGRLIQGVEKNGDRTLLTTDEVFKLATHEANSSWIPEARLHLVKLGATRSTLLDTMGLGGMQVGDMVGDSDRLFMTLRKGYSYWYGYDSRGGAYVQPSDSLTILDLSQGRLTKKFSAPVGTYSAQLMGVSGDRLFVNLPGDGVLAVDVSDLSAPVGQHFLRTLGYATHIVFAADTAFIAAGNFGIYEMDLSSKPSILHF